jgi:hypothetical protein
MCEAMSAMQEDRLSEPHVRPLMDVVRDLRARGFVVPNVDPTMGRLTLEFCSCSKPLVHEPWCRVSCRETTLTHQPKT